MRSGVHFLYSAGSASVAPKRFLLICDIGKHKTTSLGRVTFGARVDNSCCALLSIACCAQCKMARAAFDSPCCGQGPSHLLPYEFDPSDRGEIWRDPQHAYVLTLERLPKDPLRACPPSARAELTDLSLKSKTPHTGLACSRPPYDRVGDQRSGTGGGPAAQRGSQQTTPISGLLLQVAHAQLLNMRSTREAHSWRSWRRWRS